MKWRGSGRPHGNSKLGVDDARKIAKLKRHFFGASGIVAEMFGVSRRTVLDIWSGKTWRRENGKP